jgi:hypothetical protein
MKAIGGAFATGIYWFFAAAIVALFIEALIDPHGQIIDVWVAALGIPAFGGGVIFFTLLRIAEGRRRFQEISLVRAAVWGAVSAPVALVLLALLVSGGDPLRVWTTDGWRTWNESGDAIALLAAILVAATLSFAIAGWVTVKMGRSMAAGIAESGA